MRINFYVQYSSYFFLAISTFVTSLEATRHFFHLPTAYSLHRINQWQTAFIAKSSGAQEYSYALLHDSTDIVFPLIHPKAYPFTADGIKNEETIENPLWNKAFQGYTHCKMDAQDLSFFTSSTQPNTVYLLPSTLSRPVTENGINELYQIASVADAKGNPGSVLMLAAAGPTHCFALVAPEGKQFGANGSGIAHLFYGPRIEKKTEIEEINSPQPEITLDATQKKKSPNLFLQLDSLRAQISQSPHALPLDELSAVIGDEVTIHKVTNFFWEKSIQKLLITLDVSTGNNSDDRACAVLLGQIIGKDEQAKEAGDFIGTLRVEPIINFTLLDIDQDCIVARCGAEKRVHIKHAVPFSTSTGLLYLLVTRADENGQDTVFALPLITHTSHAGRIASLHSTIEEDFFKTATKRFIHRAFTEYPKTIAQLPRSDMQKLCVGACSLQGSIIALRIFGDTAYAVVAPSPSSRTGAIHKSTALFSARGEIIGWSEWQPLYIANEAIRNNSTDILFDEVLGEFIVVTPDGTNGFDLHKTEWSTSNETEHNSDLIVQNQYDSVYKTLNEMGIDTDDVLQFEEDKETLYILTRTAVYSTSLENSDDTFTIKEITSTTQEPFQDSYFTKILISGPYALLFTTIGLFAVSPGHSIAQSTPCRFEKIIIPELCGIPVAYHAITKTGYATDCTKFSGANLLILFTDFRLNQSKLYRFFVRPFDTAYVPENVLVPFADLTQRDVLSPFLIFGKKQSSIFSDGTRYFLSDGMISTKTPAKIGAHGLGNKLISFGKNNHCFGGTSNHVSGKTTVISEHGMQIHG